MFTMKETRQSIILRRLAQQMREETGDSRYRARVEETQPTLGELMWISCTRPIRKCLNPDDNIVSSKGIYSGSTHRTYSNEHQCKRGDQHVRMDSRSDITILAALGVLHVGRSVLLDQVTVYLFVSFYNLWYLVPFRLFSGHYTDLMMVKVEWYTPPLCKCSLPSLLLATQYSFSVGAFMGFGANMYQDKLYR